MNEFTFWKLIKETVTPDEIKAGDYPILLDKLFNMEHSDIEIFTGFLKENINKILPSGDAFDKDSLLCTPDVAATLQTVIGRKGG